MVTFEIQARNAQGGPVNDAAVDLAVTGLGGTGGGGFVFARRQHRYLETTPLCRLGRTRQFLLDVSRLDVPPGTNGQIDAIDADLLERSADRYRGLAGRTIPLPVE